MRLDTAQKETIRKTLKALGSSQKELSVASGYSSGNLSEFLNTALDRSVTEETWRKLLAALESIAEQRAPNCKDESAIRATVAAIRAWPVNNGNDESSANARLCPPGEQIQAEDGNHVERRGEREIEAIVKRRPKSVVLKAGMATGRSSWLSQLKAAAEADGATVVAFDQAMLTALDSRAPVAAFLSRLAEALELPALAQMHEVEHGPRQLAANTMDILRGAPLEHPLYVLIDDVDGWGGSREFAPLSEFIGCLQLQLVGNWGNNAPVFSITIVSALALSEWSSLHSSKVETQSTVVALNYFTADEVRQLAANYGLESNVADSVAAYAAGHPHHTQIILWACHHGTDLDKTLAHAQQLDSTGGWNGIFIRVGAMLRSLTKAARIDSRRLLDKFLTHFSGGAGATTFSRKEFDLLKSLGMVDGPLRNPRTSRFFLTVATAILEDEVE